jgi:hypothetical protein
MKYCQLVGCGHGSKGLVEVNNMPAIKTRQEILKPVQMPPVRPERSCIGRAYSAVGIFGRL